MRLGVLVPLLLLPQGADGPLRRGRSDAAELLGSGAAVPHHEFHFTRAAYTSWGWPSWATDFPKADRQFLIGVRRILSDLDAFASENPVRLDDPDLARFPFLYAAEVGRMEMEEGEVIGLRRYLQAGGFLVVDDFWGTGEWENFEAEIKRVLPDRKIEEIPFGHPLFHALYDVREVLQVPNVWQGVRGGRTWERDGYEPHCRGIFDDKGRLMVVINWNTDLGDAWEWAEEPRYPLRFSTFAYEMGINFIVYAMSH